MAHGRRRAWLAWLLLSACADEVGFVDELNQQAARWRALGISDYAFVWRQQCYCQAGDLVGERVEVRGAVATAAIGVRSGLSQPGFAVTLDALFERLRQYARSGLAQYEIAYDPSYHYVARFDGDQDADAIDDELALTVSCFSLDAANGCPIELLSSEQCRQRGGTPTQEGASTCGPSGRFSLGRISDVDPPSLCCSRSE